MLTMTGNKEGRLHVRRQVDDYTLRDTEFESMSFLTYMVETYERRIRERDSGHIEDDNDDNESTQVGQYLSPHPKCTTHIRVRRMENHNFLPNVVGPWFPRRDGEESTKPFYYASMLALLNPWRDLRDLKEENETWENRFNIFMQSASQRDKDVISGSQYYYESKDVVNERGFEEEMETNVVNRGEEDDDIEDENLDESAVNIPMVSRCFKKILPFFFLNLR